MSKFRFNFNAIQTLISRLHGGLCHDVVFVFCVGAEYEIAFSIEEPLTG